MPEFTIFDCTFCQSCCFFSLWRAEGFCRQNKRLLEHHFSANPSVKKMLSQEKKIPCYLHSCEKVCHCEYYSYLGCWLPSFSSCFTIGTLVLLVSSPSEETHPPSGICLMVQEVTARRIVTALFPTITPVRRWLWYWLGHLAVIKHAQVAITWHSGVQHVAIMWQTCQAPIWHVSFTHQSSDRHKTFARPSSAIMGPTLLYRTKFEI